MIKQAFINAILLKQRNLFPRRYPSAIERRKLLYRFKTSLLLKTLKKTQFFELTAQKVIQERRMQRLFSHMYRSSRFWQEYLRESGISPPFINSIDQLHRLPLLSREYVRSRDLKSLLIFDNTDTIHRATTGSSGEPFHIYWSARDYQSWTAYYLRALPEMFAFPLLRYQFTLLLGFTQENWPAGHLAQLMNAKSVQYAPHYVLYGYTSLIKDLALTQEHPHLDFVIAAAEYLDIENRKWLEDYFKVPVRRYYGMRDGGWIAWECGYQDNVMHINSERVIVEVVNEKGDSVLDERGEIILTILDSWRMPLIRYQIGDTGILKSAACPCGIRLPLLEFIGRNIEVVYLPNRKAIPVIELQGPIIDSVSGIVKIQIKQASYNKVLVYLIPQNNQAPQQDQLNILKRRMEDVLEKQVSVEITIVKELPETINGKQPFFIPLSFE